MEREDQNLPVLYWMLGSICEKAASGGTVDCRGVATELELGVDTGDISSSVLVMSAGPADPEELTKNKNQPGMIRVIRLRVHVHKCIGWLKVCLRSNGAVPGEEEHVQHHKRI